MRPLAAALLIALVLLGPGAVGASAAEHAPSPAWRAAAQAHAPVPAHDGSRVGVQLGVLGAAAFTVIVIGSAAYVVRRRLGLVPPPPEQPSDGRH